jgi:hypothetical protein
VKTPATQGARTAAPAAAETQRHGAKPRGTRPERAPIKKRGAAPPPHRNKEQSPQLKCRCSNGAGRSRRRSTSSSRRPRPSRSAAAPPRRATSATTWSSARGGVYEHFLKRAARAGGPRAPRRASQRRAGGSRGGAARRRRPRPLRRAPRAGPVETRFRAPRRRRRAPRENAAHESHRETHRQRLPEDQRPGRAGRDPEAAGLDEATSSWEIGRQVRRFDRREQVRRRGRGRRAVAVPIADVQGAAEDRRAAVRSRRPAVLRRLHAIDATRVHQTRSWVVYFWILRPFGPRRVTAMLRAGSGSGLPPYATARTRSARGTTRSAP